MMHRISFVLFILLAAACTSPDHKNPRIEIQTKSGEIEIELYADKAPLTVKTFLSYVDSGFFRNAFFYRVLNDNNQPSDAFKANFIQGGIWKSARRRSETLKGIPHESTRQTQILHTDGVISLARLEPGTATTEFFICIGDQPGFDYGGANNPDKQGYAAFGKVIRGMDIVVKIYNEPEFDQAFDPLVPIFNVKRL
ncbi:MAG: peptidylprolyl isomerase [Chitinophagaceae bacterium]